MSYEDFLYEDEYDYSDEGFSLEPIANLSEASIGSIVSVGSPYGYYAEIVSKSPANGTFSVEFPNGKVADYKPSQIYIAAEYAKEEVRAEFDSEREEAVKHKAPVNLTADETNRAASVTDKIARNESFVSTLSVGDEFSAKIKGGPEHDYKVTAVDHNKGLVELESDTGRTKIVGFEDLESVTTTITHEPTTYDVAGFKAENAEPEVPTIDEITEEHEADEMDYPDNGVPDLDAEDIGH